VQASDLSLSPEQDAHTIRPRPTVVMSRILGVPIRKSQRSTFDAQAFLDTTGVSRKIAEFRRRETIFSQGDPSEQIFYIQKGGVKLSIMVPPSSRFGLVLLLARLTFGVRSRCTHLLGRKLT